MMQEKLVCTVEARMGSTRLPGKVLLPLAGQPSLKRLCDRISKSKYVSDIIIATTTNPRDEEIVKFCVKNRIKYFRGSENDVLKRVLQAAQSLKAEILVAITGDCPLIDFRHIDTAVETLLQGNYDYVSNAIERTFPDGFDAQALRVSALEKADKLTTDPIIRVHAAYYIYQHPEIFKIKNIKAEGKMHWPELGVTLDEASDYKLINIIFEHLLPKDPYFSSADVVDYLRQNPDLLEINKDIRRKHPQEG